MPNISIKPAQMDGRNAKSSSSTDTDGPSFATKLDEIQNRTGQTDDENGEIRSYFLP